MEGNEAWFVELLIGKKGGVESEEEEGASGERGTFELVIVIVKATLSKINYRRSRHKQLMIEMCNDVKRA